MRAFKIVFLFAGFFYFSFFSSVSSLSVCFASDPSTHWSTIETPHFSVVFDSRQQQLGQTYAKEAELAFQAVAPAFGVWPDKTVIYVDDSTDLSNGSATPWPYPLIMAFPVLPLTNDVVGEYGDWSLELLTHEYTHILNFTPANGIFKPLRFIFGSIVAPNVLLPRWYAEGLAVEMETRYSKFGRLRSGSFLSIARAMSEEGKLRNEDIARINEAIPDFPGGNRAYLMGSLVWDELTRRAGDKIIGDLNTTYSRRIPFFIDGPLRERLNVGWQDILNDVYDRVEKRTNEQIASITKAGRASETLVSRTGYYTRSVGLSPDGLKLTFIGKAHNTDNQLMILERDGANSFASAGSPRKLVENTNINRISWSPDSTSFIYDAIDVASRYYQASDLYRCFYDVEKKKCSIKKLTNGLRAREPAVSPSGHAVAFIQNTPGSTRVVSVGADGSNLQVLYEPPFQTRVSNPTFVAPDELVFSERRDDGIEALRFLKVKESDDGVLTASGTPIELLTNYTPARLPQMTSRGLVFLSDKSGVSNLYLADRSLKTARALTNTTTRVLDGDIDATTGDVIYSRLEAAGAAVYLISEVEQRKVPATPPTVSALIDTAYPGLKPGEAAAASYQVNDYQPTHYLLPKYWFPYGYFLPGGLYAEATTSGMDPVGRHRYSLTAAFDTLSKKPSFYGSYVNSTTTVPITLAAQSINEYLYSSGLVRQTTAGSLSGSFFLPGLSNSWRGGLGWQYLQTQAPGLTIVRNGARASVKYSSIEQRGYEISPEKGGSISVGHSHFFESLGTVGYDQTDFSISKFLSGFILPERHALAFFFNGSIAPELKSSILGRTTVGGNFQNGLIQDSFVMRGYNSGVFLGRNLLAGTAEYRFPLMYNYRGLGTLPLFFRRLHAALFVDAITLDGTSYASKGSTFQPQIERLGTFHIGTGAELKLDTTLFYYLPVQLILGAYYGTDTALNPNGVFPFFGIGI